VKLASEITFMKGNLRVAMLGFIAALVAGCTPLYMSDTYINSTPRTKSLDVGRLTTEPVAVMGLIAPASLQGFGPSLSHALIAALTKARPPIRGIPTYETLSVINEQGLAQNYADLLSGFAPGGILERQRLRPIGSALGSRYLLLPGLAEFDQLIIDKYEVMGLKLVRTRVTTMRLWLQLWDSQSGRILWESAGELTAVNALLNAKRTVPLDELAQKLWLQMIQDDLLGEKTETRVFLRN
jgi:hypothetical protein